MANKQDIEIEVSPLVSESGIAKFKTDLKKELNKATKDVKVSPSLDMSKVENDMGVLTKKAYTINLRLNNHILQEDLKKFAASTSEWFCIRPVFDLSNANKELKSISADSEIKINASKIFLYSKTKHAIHQAVKEALNSDYEKFTIRSSQVLLSANTKTAIHDAIRKALKDTSEVFHINTSIGSDDLDSKLSKFFDEHVYPINFDAADLNDSLGYIEGQLNRITSSFISLFQDKFNIVSATLFKSKNIPITVKVRPDKDYKSELEEIKEDIKNQLESGINYTVKSASFSVADISSSLKENWEKIKVPPLKLNSFTVNKKELNSKFKKTADSLKKEVKFSIAFNPTLDDLKDKIDEITKDRSTTVSFKVDKDADFVSQYKAIKTVDKHKISLSVENSKEVQEKIDKISQGTYTAKLSLDTSELDKKVQELESGSIYKVVPTITYNEKKGKSALSELKKEVSESLGEWAIPFDVVPKISEAKANEIRSKVTELYGDKKLHITTDLDKEAYRGTKEALDSLYKDASTPVKSQLEIIQKLLDKTYSKMVTAAKESIKEGTKSLINEQKLENDNHNMRMANIKKENAEAKSSFKSRMDDESKLRKSQLDSTLRDINKEREAYSEVISELNKIKLDSIVDPKSLKDLEEIKGTLSSAVADANNKLQEATSKNTEITLKARIAEEERHNTELSNIHKERDEVLSSINVTDTINRNRIIETYAKKESEEERTHESKLSNISKEADERTSKDDIVHANEIVNAEHTAAERGAIFLKEFADRMAQLDALKDREIANNKEVSDKHEKYVSELYHKLANLKLDASTKLSSVSASDKANIKHYREVDSDYKTNNILNGRIELQKELVDLIEKGNLARKKSEISISNEVASVKQLREAYAQARSDLVREQEKEKAQQQHDDMMGRRTNESLHSTLLVTAESNKTKAIADAMDALNAVYEEAEKNTKDLRERILKGTTEDVEGTFNAIKKNLENGIKEFKKAVGEASTNYTEAVKEADEGFLENEKKRINEGMQNEAEMKDRHATAMSNLEQEWKITIQNEIEASRRRESNAKHIADLESKFAEEEKRQKLAAQEEVFNSEKKKRAESHKARLDEIKKESDAYEASINERTKERTSGYLTKSDLGVIKGTDAQTKTLDAISSIESKSENDQKTLDDKRKRYQAFINNTIEIRRKAIEKTHSDSIKIIDDEEKAKIKSIQSELVEELNKNQEISESEREAIEKTFSKRIENARKEYQEKRDVVDREREDKLNSLEVTTAKALASNSKVTTNIKAGIKESEAAAIDSIVTEFNTRKKYLDEQLAWLNDYFATEKKNIEANSEYRRKKAKLDAEYNKSIKGAESRYSYNVSQGTEDTASDLRKRVDNINTEAELTKMSIDVSDDIDEVKKFRNEFNELNRDIQIAEAETNKNIIDGINERIEAKKKERDLDEAYLRKEGKKEEERIQSEYKPKLDKLQEEADALRKSLSMEEEGTKAFDQIKEEAEKVVSEASRLVLEMQQEIEDSQTAVEDLIDELNEGFNKFSEARRREREESISETSNISKKMLAEETQIVNTKISNAKKKAEQDSKSAEELKALKERNAKFINDLESQYSEEQRSKKLKDLNELLSTEAKKREEAHKSRLDEIQKESDAYEASVNARTQEKTSGLLTESDLGVKKSTDYESQVRERIEGIRRAGEEEKKSAEEFANKYEKIFVKLGETRRGVANKNHNKALRDIDNEEKREVERINSELAEKIKANEEITDEERTALEKKAKEEKEKARVLAEAKRSSIKSELNETLRSIEVAEAKNKASVSKTLIDKKAAIDEAKAAEISAIVEAFNRQKESNEKKLAWLHRYYDAEKKRIDENSEYRKRKAKLDKEYEYYTKGADERYEATVKQGTSRTDSDFEIARDKIISSAKIEKHSILSSKDSDEAKKIKNDFVDIRKEIQLTSEESKKSLKDSAAEYIASETRKRENEVGEAKKNYAEALDEENKSFETAKRNLESRKKALEDSLSTVKKESVSWKKMKREIKDIMRSLEELNATHDSNIQKIEDTKDKAVKASEEVHNNNIKNREEELRVALASNETITREWEAEEERNKNTALKNIETINNDKRKAEEETARKRREAEEANHAREIEREREFQELLSERLDIVRRVNQINEDRYADKIKHRQGTEEIERKSMLSEEDISNKYADRNAKEERDALEKLNNELSALEDENLSKREKKRRKKFLKEQTDNKNTYNKLISDIDRKQEEAEASAQKEYDKTAFEARANHDSRMREEDIHHSVFLKNREQERKALEKSRSTMSEKEYSDKLFDIERNIASENRVHTDMRGAIKDEYAKKIADAEDELRNAKRKAKEEADASRTTETSKFNDKDRKSWRDEKKRREDRDKSIKAEEAANERKAKEEEERLRKQEQEKKDTEQRINKFVSDLQDDLRAKEEAKDKKYTHERELNRKRAEEESEARARSRRISSEYSGRVEEGKDTYKDTLKRIDRDSESRKNESESQNRVELERRIADIRSSSEDRSVQNEKIEEARKLSALKLEHETILRNIDTESNKRKAFLEFYKANKTAASKKMHDEALAEIKSEKSEKLKAVDEEIYALSNAKDELTVEEYHNRRKELEEKRIAIEDEFKLKEDKEDESHKNYLRLLNKRTEADKDSIDKIAKKRTVAEKERYALSSIKVNPAQEIAESTLGGKKGDIFKEVKQQSQKLVQLFDRGLRTVWSNYTKYGKGAIQTVSRLFKTTLQKTLSGSRKLNELLGLSRGTKEVNQVTEALDRLKSKILSIAGISISLNTILGTTDASSELIEMQNVVDTVFGELSDSVNTFAKSANESLGLTEFQAKKFTSIFGSMFKTSGVSIDSAKMMGENLTALSADLASFFDADFTEAFDKVKSGLAGMIMPLRAYGIDLSVASMQQYMLDKGIQATWKDLSISEKQLIRYNYMLEHTTDMQGDFAKTIGSWANQWRLLKNQVRELAVITGSFIEKYLYPLIRGFNTFLGVLIQVGRELQKIFHFESSDLLKQQGLEDANKGIAVESGYAEEESEIDDLTSSTDKLTDAKKKLQKQNERQEASFDSLIKLSKQSTESTDEETQGTTPNKKGNGAGLDLKPLDYSKGLDLSDSPIKLPKWATKIIAWAKEIEGLFSKYKKKLDTRIKELGKAWKPVSDKFGSAIDWIWKTILKPFLEWLLDKAIPKTIDLLKVLGGVVDSVLDPIGDKIKEVWKKILEPFFKSIGTKYINWVDDSIESLKDWKKEFDKLDSVDAKLKFLKSSIQKWFEGTIKKIFGDKSDEVLEHFYSSWDSLTGVFDNIFSSSEELAEGKLFSDEFKTALGNIVGAFTSLSTLHFSNVASLFETLTDNQVPLSSIASALAEDFGQIETMVFDGLKTLIDTIANNEAGATSVASSITSMMTAIGGTVFTRLDNTLDKLLSSGTSQYYIGLIRDALVEISNLAFDAVDSLIDWLGEEETKNNVEKIKDNIVKAFDNITKFITDHKEEALNLIKGATGLIKWATDHPGAVAAALIGGDLLGVLGQVSVKVLGVKGSFELLGKVGSNVITALSNPLVQLIIALGLAYGLYKGLEEQFDANASKIEQSHDFLESQIETSKKLLEDQPIDTTNLEKYNGLLEDLGVTVTSTGQVMSSNWGDYRKFTEGLEDSSSVSQGTVKKYKEALSDYGFATEEAVKNMTDEQVIESYKSAVITASTEVSRSLEENTETIKELTAKSAEDLDTWTTNIFKNYLTDEDVWDQLDTKNEANYAEIKKVVGEQTAEIAKMTGELPAVVLQDISNLIANGAKPEQLTEYFDSYKAAISEPAEATEDAAEKMEDASDSMEKSTKEVQKSADAVDLENAVESIKGLADAYDEATDASNRMKLSSSIDKLLDYYQKLYINGQLSAEEYANHINRLTDYKLKLEEATDGVLDVMREARTGQDNEQQLFSEEQTAHFEALASQFGSDVNGLKEAMIESIGELNFTDEQRKFFYEQMVPKMDDFIKEDISENVGNELGSTYDKGIEKANDKITNKIEIEASVPDPNSKEANEASNKAEKVGKNTGESLTEGAQGEVDSNKLSTDTYVENGSEKNKETANKEGTKVGKEVTKATKTEIANSTFSLSKAFENAKDENTETAIKAGGDTAKIALSEMRKTVRSSKIDLADALHVEISAKRIDYIANAINYLLISAFSRVQKIDLSSKLTLSGTSSSLPVAHGNSILSEVKTRGIPHLAKGAVIPPRSRFLAVLGDQHSGYNIETPLDTMIDAFKIALQDAGLLNRGSSDQPIQLTVQIGSEKLDDRIINVVDSREVRSGGL